MHEAAFPAIAELIPHRGGMCLLDAVTGAGPEWIEASVTVAADKPFAGDSGTGAWVGIEYMAQAVAAFAGLRALERGEAVRIGFLVSARSYECSAAEFAHEARLRVRAEHRFESTEGVGSFSCSIRSARGELLASSVLTVFQPADPAAFLAGEGA